MLKKFASSICVIALLAGCSSKKDDTDTVKIQDPVSSVNQEQNTEETGNVAEEAKQLVDTLGMSDTMDEPLVSAAVNGLFFQGDSSLTTDACVYLSKVAGNSDTVAVFATKNTDDVENAIQKYLDSTKANATEYFGEEVQKISDAVVESNKNQVILVIASDKDQAKSAVDSILK